MKSNGFGRMEQSIVIHVPREQAMQLESLLDCVALKQEYDQERSYFLWRRWSTRAGDDEDVVFALSTHLDRATDRLDWTIDWIASEY